MLDEEEFPEVKVEFQVKLRWRHDCKNFSNFQKIMCSRDIQLISTSSGSIDGTEDMIWSANRTSRRFSYVLLLMEGYRRMQFVCNLNTSETFPRFHLVAGCCGASLTHLLSSRLEYSALGQIVDQLLTTLYDCNPFCRL